MTEAKVEPPKVAWWQGTVLALWAGALCGGLVRLWNAVYVERWFDHELTWTAISAVASGVALGGMLGLTLGIVAALPRALGRGSRATRTIFGVGAIAIVLLVAFRGERWDRLATEASTSELAGPLGAALAAGVLAFAVLPALAAHRSLPAKPLAIGAFILLVGAWCVPILRPRADAPNLLLISVDTLRANRLGCYGYEPARSGNIDTLAAQGTLFETVISSAPITMPSMSTIMTGLDPQEHGVRYNGFYALDSSSLTLAEVLREHGYETRAVISNFVLERTFQIDQGFAEFDDHMTAPMRHDHADTKEPDRGSARQDTWWNRQLLDGNAQKFADEVTDAALATMANADGEPFFLWVHYMDPHLPYDPPTGYREFGDPYDGEVAFVDTEIGRLIEGLRDRLGDNTVIAFVADHGELLPGERGKGKGHVRFLYDVTVHVPFFVLGPGIEAGVRVDRPLRARAIPRILLETLDLEAPASFAERMQEPWYAYSESYQPVIKALDEGDLDAQPMRMVRDGQWKLIEREAGVFELYDLNADPEELFNLAEKNAEALETMRALLALEVARDTGGDLGEVSDDTWEKLRELGYVGEESSPGVIE